jgi:uncharacterized cupin superfamily protein
MTEKAPTTALIEDLPVRTGTIYPTVLAGEVQGRSNVALGNIFGLTQFGANITTLKPGAWSSHRHAHAQEDELLLALEGEMVIVDNHGRHPFRSGMVAGFKAGSGNAHKVINETDTPVRFLVIGTRSKTESVDYPDVDMKAEKTGGNYLVTRKDGSSF